jgi:hypothetical protein
MYDTTPSITEDVLSRAIACCAADSTVRRVAVSALATGYGHLNVDQFLSVASRVLHDSRFAAIDDILICIEDGFTFQMAREFIQNHDLPMQIDAESCDGANRLPIR